MRWKKKNKRYPQDEETRIITRFLIFPKCIDNQYRWLELVKIEQFYREYDCERDVGGYWVDRCWYD